MHCGQNVSWQLLEVTSADLLDTMVYLFTYLFIIFLLCRIAVHSIRCSLLLPMLRVLCVCVSICWSQWRNWQRCRLTQVRSRNHDQGSWPPEKDNGQCWENFWLVVTPTPTHNCLMALFPGLPGWACIRRNIHPLTPVLLIRHALSTSSIYYDL